MGTLAAAHVVLRDTGVRLGEAVGAQLVTYDATASAVHVVTGGDRVVTHRLSRSRVADAREVGTAVVLFDTIASAGIASAAWRSACGSSGRPGSADAATPSVWPREILGIASWRSVNWRVPRVPGAWR
jgi:hypothetical protein